MDPISGLVKRVVDLISGLVKRVVDPISGLVKEGCGSDFRTS